jgi:RNA polymerase sigma-70 factor (ECF subfamily)
MEKLEMPLSPQPSIPVPLEEMGDKQLIAAYQQGDRSTFQYLVMKYETRVFNHCMRIVGDKEESADLTQEVFLKVFRNIEKYEHTYAFYTWLYRITVNCCIDYLREKKRRIAKFPLTPIYSNDGAAETKEVEIPDERFGPENRAINLELNRTLNEALGSLPENLRSIIVLKEVEGLSYAEIADIVKCSLGTVKSRMHRARVQLKEYLTPHLNA